MSEAFGQLQQALYNHLKADAELMALIRDVFDQPPQNEPYPYVTIGPFDSTPVVNRSDSERMGVDTDIYTDGESWVLGQAIKNHMMRLLRHARLETTDYVFYFRPEFFSQFYDTDGDVRQINLRWLVFGMTPTCQ